MGSRRIQICQTIRDALNPLFPGGCELWRQRGSDMATLPRAIVHPESDTPAGQTTSHSGGPGGGTNVQSLEVVVEVYLVERGDSPIDVEQPQPDPVDPQTVESADEWIAIAEDAVEALEINDPATTLGTAFQALVLTKGPPTTRFNASEDGRRLISASITFTCTYRRSQGATSEAS